MQVSSIWENMLEEILIKNMCHLRETKKQNSTGVCPQPSGVWIDIVVLDWNRTQSLLLEFSLGDISEMVTGPWNLGFEWRMALVRKVLKIGGDESAPLSFRIKTFRIYRCGWQFREVATSMDSGYRLPGFECQLHHLDWCVWYDTTCLKECLILILENTVGYVLFSSFFDKDTESSRS